jgi:hypothetical protein
VTIQGFKFKGLSASGGFCVQRRRWPEKAASLIEKETLKKRTVEPQNVECRMSKEGILSIL